ncbi:MULTISPECIES: collagen-like protein [Paenibacillus]|uniref:collagen-like protein n=1 Tax=Paenibacillus TaxID=44249 RepID=UPI000979F599|nr:collagen-like protein [Paenibacillus odorifer]OMD29084.1 hypothetical protein BJP48_18490 [Paenibacillus odorifer]OME53785.1 hypothetical protein BSK61_16275 [Paenibacillus odorifer]
MGYITKNHASAEKWVVGGELAFVGEARITKDGEEVSLGGDGVPGPTGPKGDKGDIGATGPKGDKGDTGAAGTSPAVGTPALLQAGSDAVQRSWSAKDISDEIKRQIAAISSGA